MTRALVLMAYGTPSDPGEVEAYYTHIRRGRPPSEDDLADLHRRYRAIGGVSPLRARTEAQVAAVAAELEARDPGGWRVLLGMKHSPPFIEDAAEQALAGGPEELVGLVLAPHFSTASVGQYFHRLEAAVAGRVPVHTVPTWHAEPALVRLLGERVAAGRTGLPAGSAVVFTAHSLPEKVISEGDRYAELVEESAQLIASAADLDPGGWRVAYQSAGRTRDVWLGPSLAEAIDELADRAAPGVLVCPVGFVSDHLEVLYDLDIEARRHAAGRGLAFARTPSLNDDPTLMALVAELAERSARG